MEIDGKKVTPGVCWLFNCLGVLVWAVAAWMLFSALNAPTAIPGDSSIGPIVNLQLMQNQMAQLHFGIGAAIVGTLLLGFSAVIHELSLSRR